MNKVRKRETGVPKNLMRLKRRIYDIGALESISEMCCKSVVQSCLSRTELMGSKSTVRERTQPTGRTSSLCEEKPNINEFSMQN